MLGRNKVEKVGLSPAFTSDRNAFFVISNLYYEKFKRNAMPSYPLYIYLFVRVHYKCY
jgi:hypothetical protein